MIIVEQVVYIINNGKQVDEHKRGTVLMALTGFYGTAANHRRR